MQIPISEIENQKKIMRTIREEFSQKIMDAAQSAKPLGYVDTYGCQQNESDSEKIRGMLIEMGCVITHDEYVADIIVINTCAIRENAENRVFGNVGDLVHTKKAKPNQLIAVCGCMAAISENVERIRDKYKHVDMVFSPADLWRFPELVYQVLSEKHPTKEDKEQSAKTRERIKKSKTLHTLPSSEYPQARIAEGLPNHRDMKIKAWLPIMHGCNNFCAYCIVPYVRGREVSREPSAILAEAKEIIDAGYKDITLLGQNVNSYNPVPSGKACEVSEVSDFPKLIRELSKLDGEFLIRFMTSHPKDAGEELFRAMAESEKVARHIHLPFQAGNDRILKLMNRGYTSAEYLDKLAFARELMPDIVITSDVIVGYPGETDEEFEDTLRLVEKAQFDAMFTFIYSRRPHTAAAKLSDTTTREEKQIRFDKLLELQNAISDEKHVRHVGKTVRVLVDDFVSDDEVYSLRARTNGGRLVHLIGDSDMVGKFADIKIIKSSTWALFGEKKR